MLARVTARVAAPRAAPALFSRGLAGPVKVLEVSQEDFYGPATVERDFPIIEAGVRYEAGVPSPMEGAHYGPPVVVDGLIAKTGGEGLGCPVQYIKLSAWDPTPVDCKYTGLRFVSKKALDYAAKQAAK